MSATRHRAGSSKWPLEMLGRVIKVELRMDDGNLTARLKTISESAAFHAAVVGVIIANAVVVGLETSRPLATAYAPLFTAAHAAVLMLFIAELAIRVAAHGFRLGTFLRDG